MKSWKQPAVRLESAVTDAATLQLRSRPSPRCRALANELPSHHVLETYATDGVFPLPRRNRSTSLRSSQQPPWGASLAQAVCQHGGAQPSLAPSPIAMNDEGPSGLPGSHPRVLLPPIQLVQDNGNSAAPGRPDPSREAGAAVGSEGEAEVEEGPYAGQHAVQRRLGRRREQTLLVGHCEGVLHGEDVSAPAALGSRSQQPPHVISHQQRQPQHLQGGNRQPPPPPPSPPHHQQAPTPLCPPDHLPQQQQQQLQLKDQRQLALRQRRHQRRLQRKYSTALIHVRHCLARALAAAPDP
ncbi:hypothetical protein Agub_g13418, partial [Astrephomene gubernaculifera]